MSVRLRILWLVLLAVAITLGATEGAWQPRLERVRGLSIRVTISPDRRLRLEAPDGTDLQFGSLARADPATADSTLDRLRVELARLVTARDDSGQSTNVLEIVADEETPFHMVLWVMMVGFDARVRIRSIGLWLPRRPDSYLSYEEPPEDPYPGHIYSPTPLAIVRFPPSKGGHTETRAVAALATGHASETGDVSLPPIDHEEVQWRPIHLNREAVHRWLDTAKEHTTNLLGALALQFADRDVPYGAVREVLRGFKDASTRIQFVFISR